jgi:hypothetical protein
MAVYLGNATRHRAADGAANIPRADFIVELARFWDSHDLTDFDGELEEVVEPVFGCEALVNAPLPAKEDA